jgi:hypothetical protein
MPHVHIDPSGVGQKTPIARRLIVATVMKVEHASSLNMEQMIPNLLSEPSRRRIGAIFVYE